MTLSLPTLETGSRPFYYLWDYLRKEKKLVYEKNIALKLKIIDAFFHLQVFDLSLHQFYIKSYASGLTKNYFSCGFHPR